MKAKISLKQKQIEYTLKLSRRARRMRLAIYPALSTLENVAEEVLPHAHSFSNGRCSVGKCWVYCDGNFVVTAPQSFSTNVIEQFINQKANWIINKLEYFKNFTGKVLPKISKKDYLKYKQEAKVLTQNRLEYFNQFYGFKFSRVNIKNQKTRWGSCSRKGNLNFNYKIVLLPAAIADYIIVHELCHLKEFNHSRSFWNLVAQTIPNYLELRTELKKNRINFF